MSSTKAGNQVWDDHNIYIIHVLENGSYCIYKNADYINALLIDDCPQKIHDELNIELRRIKNNLYAGKQNKKNK